MVAKAEGKYIRISPTKVRLVSILFKGRNAKQALVELNHFNKKAAGHLKKVLHSALANAKIKGYDEDKLFISKMIANSGPTLKRYRAASFGRATPVRKRTSHIVVELDSPEKLVKKGKTK
ncbi:MAG: 50S ribosomal protein L22 [Candidatus Omnitrophica bacterium]|nr:50S ribosomal protein L22 [Candidatus Omnitrophota bacterium]MBU2250937.1 50S ribosomal protein L22 [Candidatus Omnitrophota bacterium]MBU2265869.1 50S ribosomal protein L22 [Candidatus Omnitrophota bacterium]MBU2474206.1 50S ribosomal protein L22 [Candidatus Omnitrophota bacterium]